MHDVESSYSTAINKIVRTFFSSGYSELTGILRNFFVAEEELCATLMNTVECNFSGIISCRYICKKHTRCTLLMCSEFYVTYVFVSNYSLVAQQGFNCYGVLDEKMDKIYFKKL